MKKKIVFSAALSAFLLAAIMVSATNGSIEKEAQMPKNVKVIIEKSCFGCHNTDSKNEDAREDLDFKTFGELSGAKMVLALKEITEVLEEDEMPPKKFLQKNPDRALTANEKKVLLDWAKSEAESLKNK